MTKAVFFDVANTLLDKPQLFPSVQRVLRLHGITVDRETLSVRHKLLSDVIDFPDKTSAEFYHDFNTKLLRQLGVLPTQKLLSDIFEACSYLPWEVFPDVGALESLSFRKGIASNWDKSLSTRLSEKVSLNFEWILGSGAAGVRKPNREFYEQLISITGLESGEILMVGDSIRLDIEPALSIGMNAILIDRLGIFKQGTCRIIRSMNELIDYI